MKKLSLFLLLAAIAPALFANNIQVSNVSLTGQNTTNHTTQVQFTLSWDNSWRVSAGPSNWDAAWVFVKYRINSQGPWLHASLNNSGQVAPSGSTIDIGLYKPASPFNIGNPGKGAFIYRSANGSGTFTVANAQLQWAYGNIDNVADAAVTDVQVFAIEMVYIPQGAFAVGDGSGTNNIGIIHDVLTTINTADARTVASGTGSLGGMAGGYPSGFYSGGSVVNSNMPSFGNWPNGYNAYYMMKYKITQQGYVDFLNTLATTQQAAMVGTVSSTNTYAMSNSSTMQNRNGIRIDASTNSLNKFYCDYNGNSIGGEAGDGQNIACNYLGNTQMLSYLCWAGLRPFTNLEYEKACRGPLLPITGEYAWGSTYKQSASGLVLVNGGTATEAATIPSNYLSDPTNNTVLPYRVGIHAGSTTTREQSGAGYYGCMDLYEDLSEFAVGYTYTSDARSFLGSHGKGVLNSTTGLYPNTDWPTDAAPGLLNVGVYYGVSAFFDIGFTNGYLNRGGVGGRGARTAP